jgi:phenylacetate-CoA ligase
MSSLYTKIYNKSPILIQNLIISGYGVKLFLNRYRKDYRQEFERLKNKDFGKLENEHKEQLARLSSFITYAKVNSLFYKESLKDFESPTTLTELSALPILEKETFRNRITDFYTIKEDEGLASFTGGTTGKALKVVFTKSDFQKRMAYLDAFKHRIGIDVFKVRKATFSGRELIPRGTNTKNVFWRVNRIYNQRLYSTFHLNNSTIPYYIKDLNRFKPGVVNGFVSALNEIALFINHNKVELSFRPQAIFTTSETLTDWHRTNIETAFNCKVYNQYASAEGAPFITECAQGNLHYNIDTGVIEVLESKYGKEMLVTSFTTHGTPLIRYRIGDLVEFKDGTCSCGLSHPLVQKIEGRNVEFLIASNGNKVSLSHLADVIKGMPNSVIKMQFIQAASDKLEVKIVKDIQLYTQEHENSIREELSYRFGDAMMVTLNYVDDIPKEASGKYMLIKNKKK